jgi:hypothetical protein
MAVSRTRSSTQTTPSPDPGSGRHFLGQVPVAAVRTGNHRKRAIAAGGQRAAPHAARHLPRSAGAVPGQDAGRRPGSRSRAAARTGSARRVRSPGPPTVPAALNTSKCRTQAPSAGRLTGYSRPNPAGSGVTPNCGRQTEHPVMSPYLATGSHQPKECIRRYARAGSASDAS